MASAQLANYASQLIKCRIVNFTTPENFSRHQLTRNQLIQSILGTPKLEIKRMESIRPRHALSTTPVSFAVYD